MLFDWFTVAAQIVNFLILVALLKRFLYSRILRAIDERESKLAAQMAQTAEKNHEVQRELERCRCQTADLENKREELLVQARQDAERKRDELLDQARQSVVALETRWREEWEKEKGALLREFQRRAAEEVLGIARQAVADLTSADLEDCAIKAFLEKLRSLRVPALEPLAKEEIVIRSGRDVPELTRQKIRGALEAQIHAPVRLRFERFTEPGWGIELRANGSKIGWSSNTYLDQIGASLTGALDATPAATK